jgi:hypothetical protein
MDSIKRYHALSNEGSSTPIVKYQPITNRNNSDERALFSNIEELYEINKALLVDLVELVPQVNKLSDDAAPCPPIADVFLRHLPKFSGYPPFLPSPLYLSASSPTISMFILIYKK